MKKLIAASALLLVVTGCSDGSGSADSSQSQSASPSASSSASSAAPKPVRAKPAPKPKLGACYRMGYDQAVAPTNNNKPVPCDKPHTTQTYYVGTLDTFVDGHLVAVDSDRAQEQVAQECPRRLPDYLSGSEDDVRLSTFSSIWFSPTLAQSDDGQSWYRCDVIALEADRKLARLDGDMVGALGDESRAAAYGTCSDRKPGEKGFQRTRCGDGAAWRAVSVVPLEGGDAYPGEQTVSGAGTDTCTDTARESAADALNFEWGWEYPTAKQWDAGQHYGFCWVPASNS